jgi:hypothetical protein
MPRNRVVTEKQKKVIEGIIKEGKTKQQAMLDAGYSESYARASQIQHTESFNELLEKKIPNDKLVEAVETLLNLSTHKEYSFSDEMEEKEVYKALRKMGHLKRDCYVYKEKAFKKIGKDLIEYHYWRALVKIPYEQGISSGADKLSKLKGLYAPDRQEVSVTGLEKRSDEELEKMLEELNDEIGIKK